MGCPIKECKLPHKNMSEHYADNVAKSPGVAKPLLKEAVIVKPFTKPFTKPDIKPGLTFTKPLLKAKTNKEMVYAWREKNRKKYNDYQRELMLERKRGDKYDSEEEGT